MIQYDQAYPQSNKANWPSYTSEIYYSNQFGLGIIDSALIDWFARGQGFYGLISNDHDLLLAQESGAVPGATFYTTHLHY